MLVSVDYCYVVCTVGLSSGSLYVWLHIPLFVRGVLMVFPFIFTAIFWSGTCLFVFLSVIFICIVMLSFVWIVCGSVIFAVALCWVIVRFLVTCFIL